MTMLPSIKILYNATKKKFPEVAKQLKTKDSTVFRLKFGNTYTDWCLTGRFDYMSERLLLINKTFCPEFLSKDDEAAYLEFSEWARTWVYIYK